VLDGGELVGMFSERDYARKVALLGRTSPETLVGEIMTTHVTSVRPDTSIVDCMELMSEKHIRHLPVCEGGDPVGLISIGDVVKALLNEKEFLIRQLEKYISGSR